MEDNPDWRPRIAADVSPEVYYTLRKYIPQGQQKQVFSFMLEDLAELLEKDPVRVLTSVLMRELGVRGILKLDVKVLKEEEDGKPR